MAVGFLHPEALWLLAIVAALALALRWRARTHPGAPSEWAPLRAVAAAFIVLALAQPTWTLRTASKSVAYLLDTSRSMSAESLVDALAWIGGAEKSGASSQAQFIAFGARVQAFDSLEALEGVRLGGDQSAVAGRGIDDRGTDLEHALDAARALLGQERDRRIVLFTDGNQTRGDALRAVSRLRAAGVPVFVVPARVDPRPRAWIDSLSFLSPVRLGAPVLLSVHANANDRAEAQVEVLVDGVLQVREQIRLLPGSNEWARPMRFSRAGTRAVQVRLSIAKGDDADHDSRTEFVRVDPRVRVLYLERVRDDARHLAHALRREGMDVTVADAGRMGHLGALDRYDVVILSDVPAAQAEHTIGADLERYVREGGGLVFAGGSSTHGQGGFSRTRIESILPVRFRDRRRQEQLDLVLLIDRSTSMQGTKLEFAKAAALELMEALPSEARLSVIAFSGKPREVLPLQHHDDRVRAAAAIGAVSAGGQTDIFSALWHVRGMLKPSQAAEKHVILLSDGDTVPVATMRSDVSVPHAPEQGDSRPGDFRALTALLEREGISVSTVAVGEAPEIEFMRNIASWTGGASHVARSEAQIPALIVGDARKFTSDSIVERPFRATLRWRPATLDGIDFQSAPPLLGQVIARAKPHAEVLLEGIDKRPLLVRTHHGLGRSIAFLSDAKPRWAAHWLEWSGFGRFWAQLVRSAVRIDDQAVSWHLVQEQGMTRIVLVAHNASGAYANGLRVSARIVRDEEVSRSIVLVQTGPGRYERQLDDAIAQPGDYRIELEEFERKLPGNGRLPPPLTLNVPSVPDERFLVSNLALLETIARATGGSLSPSMQAVFSERGAPGVRKVMLWPWCTAAALACLFGELLLRRRRKRPVSGKGMFRPI